MAALPEWAWNSSAASLLLLISGGLGYLADQPWLFPSLGPVALLRVSRPVQPSSRLYNTLIGHWIGIAAGYFCVFLFKAYLAPAVISTEHLTMPRFWASVSAIFLTALAQTWFKAFHPPAASTALLITLGSFRFGLKELEILVVGILLVATVSEGLRRLRE